jgi:hypothetical protein
VCMYNKKQFTYELNAGGCMYLIQGDSVHTIFVASKNDIAMKRFFFFPKSLE